MEFYNNKLRLSLLPTKWYAFLNGINTDISGREMDWEDFIPPSQPQITQLHHPRPS